MAGQRDRTAKNVTEVASGEKREGKIPEGTVRKILGIWVIRRGGFWRIMSRKEKIALGLKKA